jgi:hypothetical protein
MLKTMRILTLLILSLLPAGLAMSEPSGNDPQDAQLEMATKQLACVEKERQHGITWSDICDIQTDQPTFNAPITDSDLFKERQYTIAPEFSYISYQEPSAKVREKGMMYGIYGAYDWRPQEAQSWPANVLHLDNHVNFGWVDYKSPSGIINNIPDILTEPRVWIGRDFSPFNFTRLTPYIGLGYRLLYDHLGKASDVGGYDRMSHYFYAPVGFEFVSQAQAGWSLGFNAEYDIFIQGWQQSYLSDVSSSYPNLNNRQSKGFGLRSSIDIIKKMGDINLVFSPYIRYWNIHQSKTSTAVNNSSGISFSGYEPTNNSTEIGAQLGVQF